MSLATAENNGHTLTVTADVAPWPRTDPIAALTVHDPAGEEIARFLLEPPTVAAIADHFALTDLDAAIAQAIAVTREP